jgi:flagellar hook-basal body complex protein FliE
MSPPIDRERLFYEGADTVTLSRLSRKQAAFLDTAIEQKGPDTGTGAQLYYGFPAYVGEDCRITPLFFTPAEADRPRGGSGPIRLSPERGRHRLINHHVFRREGYVPEQVATIQEELEAESTHFPRALTVALGHLAETGTETGPKSSDFRRAQPLPSSPRPGLHASPLLFLSRYSAYTYNLEKDLSALQRYDFLQREAPSTAFGALMEENGESRGGRAPIPAEVLRLNDEQRAAVQSARTDRLSVVTGPPGTGKSQVVVDLLASAVLDDTPVLFASKNNKAVDVVRERLREILGEPFDFTFRLGSRRAMEDTEKKFRDRLDRLEDRQEELRSQFSPAERKKAQGRVDDVREAMSALQEAREDLQSAVAAREEVEKKLPADWTRTDPPGSPEALPLRELQQTVSRAKALAGETRLGFWLWIQRLVMGARLLQGLQEDAEALTEPLPMAVRTDAYQRIYGAESYGGVLEVLRHLQTYRTWIERQAEEREAHRAFDARLDGAAGYDERMHELQTELTEASRALFRIAWIGAIVRNLSAVRRRVREYFEAVRGIRNTAPSGYRNALDRLERATSRLAEYLPVWIVTNLSVRNALPLRPNLFDLAIVDEASQCDVASGVPLLFRARRSVVIGDPKQLRHITPLRREVETRIATEVGASGLVGRWSYVENSLYDVAERAQEDRGQRPTLLRRHYRSHPDIIGFSNDQFYGGRLRCMRGWDDGTIPPEWRGVRWFDVQGEVPDGIRSAYNRREIQAVRNLLRRWVEEGLLAPEGPSVGVVTPFRAQTERIQETLRQEPWWTDLRETVDVAPVGVGTAHRYQGDERDLMIFSPVVAPGIRPNTARWVAHTEQLLNVAITRARLSLQVVGHLEHCRMAGGALAAFADYVADRSLMTGQNIDRRKSS